MERQEGICRNPAQIPQWKAKTQGPTKICRRAKHVAKWLSQGSWPRIRRSSSSKWHPNLLINLIVVPNAPDFLNFRVYMRCVTWSRDSHGLFDYESRYINKKNIKTTKSGRIIRLENDVELIGLDEAPEDMG